MPEIFEDGGMAEYQEAYDRKRLANIKELKILLEAQEAEQQPETD